MNLDELDYVLESLLLVSGNGLNIKDITDLLGLQPSEVQGSIKRLKKNTAVKAVSCCSLTAERCSSALTPITPRRWRAYLIP